MQRSMVSSQHGNLDDSSRAELPEMNSVPVDYHLEGGNLTSNGLASPGLQSVLSAGSEATETYHTTKAVNSTGRGMGSPSIIKDNSEVAHQAPERKKKKPWLFFIIGAIACLIIGLALGLGVGLTRKSSTKPTTAAAQSPTQPSSGGTSPTPNYLSTVGAFNGTGIALASKSSGGDLVFLESSGEAEYSYGSVVMYFQHHTGDVREMQLHVDPSGKNEWVGGNSSDLVLPAGHVKNGTPIAAVSYTINSTAAWHIFYISIDNTVQEMTNNDTTNNWVQGPINNLNLQTIDDPHVGLQACLLGPSNSTPTDGSSDQTIGINLWYTKDSTSFGFASWTAGDNTWTQEEIFSDYNGHGGVGCYVPYESNVTYVMFVNLQNETNILWKDLSTTDGWTKTTVSIPVFQNTSIGYTDDYYYDENASYLYTQNSNLSISGWLIHYDTENTSVQTNLTTTINGAKGIPGTHLTCYTTSKALFEVLYQTNGTNIERSESGLDGEAWTTYDVMIPAS